MSTTPDMTVDFIDRLKTNGKTALMVGAATGGFGDPATMATKRGLRYAWFYRQVRNGGPWDLKNNAYKAYKKTGLIICGNTYGNDMPGNFHYGFVGAAAGFSDLILHKAAGVAQERAGTSKPEYHCTYGDDPQDFEFVRLGIKLFDEVGLSVTEASLKSALAKFQTIVCTP
jgi:hypothetical protein